MGFTQELSTTQGMIGLIPSRKQRLNFWEIRIFAKKFESIAFWLLLLPKCVQITQKRKWTVCEKKKIENRKWDRRVERQGWNHKIKRERESTKIFFYYLSLVVIKFMIYLSGFFEFKFFQFYFFQGSWLKFQNLKTF